MDSHTSVWPRGLDRGALFLDGLGQLRLAGWTRSGSACVCIKLRLSKRLDSHNSVWLKGGDRGRSFWMGSNNSVWPHGADRSRLFLWARATAFGRKASIGVARSWLAARARARLARTPRLVVPARPVATGRSGALGLTGAIESWFLGWRPYVATGCHVGFGRGWMGGGNRIALFRLAAAAPGVRARLE